MKHYSIAILLSALPTLQLSSARAENSAPNILFAIADDWSLHAGAYGTKWVKTPSFDRVARDGILFNHAYTPTAKCAPSRASIITGRHPWLLKAAANHNCHFPAEFKTWSEAFAEHGWFVGFTGKGWSPGVAVDGEGNPRNLTGRPFQNKKLESPASGISNIDYAANFQEFLDAKPTDKPWCFWYGALEPHRGYEYGSGVAKGGKKLTDIDRVPGYWPDNETVRNDMLDYAFEVEHYDRHLGRMLQTLEERGMLSNTIVIVTSDHGMPFPRVKGNAYNFANHVPLAVMWPDGIAKPGRVVDDFVTFPDLAPTFIELAGLKWTDTGMANPSGKSLANILRSEKSGVIEPARDHVLLGKERTDIGRPNDWGYPTRGIIRDQWLYLKNFEPSRWPAGNPETGYLDCDGGATKTFILEARRKDPTDESWAFCFGMRPGEELYDLRRDPDCLHNLITEADASTPLDKLRETMLAELKAQGDPRMEGRGAEFDTYPYADEKQIHFHEKFMRGEKPPAGWVRPGDFEPSPIPTGSNTN